MFEDLRRRLDDVLDTFEAHRSPASRHFSAAIRGLSDALRAAGVDPPLLAGFERNLGSLHAERRVRSSRNSMAVS
jgi:hypothetical protein